MNEGSNRLWVDHMVKLLGEIKGGKYNWDDVSTSIMDLPMTPYKLRVVDRLDVTNMDGPSNTTPYLTNYMYNMVITKDGKLIELKTRPDILTDVKYAVSANQGRLLKDRLVETTAKVDNMEKTIGVLSRNVANTVSSSISNVRSGVIDNIVFEGLTFQNSYGGLIEKPLSNSTYINKTFFGNYFYELDCRHENHEFDPKLGLSNILPNKSYMLVVDVIENTSNVDLLIDDTIFVNKYGEIPAGKIGRYVFEVTTKPDIFNKPAINILTNGKGAKGSVKLRFYMLEGYYDELPDYVYDLDSVGDKCPEGYKVELKIFNEGNIESFANHDCSMNFSKVIVMGEDCLKIPLSSLVNCTVLKGFKQFTQYTMDVTFKKEILDAGDLVAYIAYTDGTEELVPMLNKDDSFIRHRYTSQPNKTIYFIRFLSDDIRGNLYFQSDGMLLYESKNTVSNFNQITHTIFTDHGLHSLGTQYIDKLFYNGHSYVVEYQTWHIKDILFNNIEELTQLRNESFSTYRINLETSCKGLQNIIDPEYAICNRLPNLGQSVLLACNSEGFYIEQGIIPYLYIRIRNFTGNIEDYINSLGLEFILPIKSTFVAIKGEIPPISFDGNIRLTTRNFIQPRVSFSINTDLLSNIKTINGKITELQNRMGNYLSYLSGVE